jgi:hypothetical protein
MPAMRRMLRHLFTLCLIMSLLLCVAIAVLWAHSYKASDVFGYVHPQWSLGVGSTNGHMMLSWTPAYAGPGALQFPNGFVWNIFPAIPDENDPLNYTSHDRFARWGVAYDRNHVQTNRRADGKVTAYNTGHRIFVPHWIVLVPPMILLAIGMRRLIWQRHASKAGLCFACGYDLRASPGRCSECGTLPATRVIT